MADKLTITIEANDQAAPVIESLRRKLEELSKQTENTTSKTLAFDGQVKSATSSIEAMSEKTAETASELARSGQIIAQTGRDIGKSFGTEMIASVSGSLTQLVQLMSGWGANAARSFATGLKSGSGDIADAANQLSDILAGYLQIHSPTRLGPLSVEDPKLWTQRLAKLLSEGLLSGKDLIEKGVSDISSIFAQLGTNIPFSLTNEISKVQSLFGSPNISQRFLMQMETGSRLPFDTESLRAEFEDYKKAQDYQAFYDTVVKWPASGASYGDFVKDLQKTYAYSDIPKMLEGSSIDKGTGLPTAIADTKWFKALAPEYSMGQLEMVNGLSLKNYQQWLSLAGTVPTEFRQDWESIGASQFIEKYGTSMLNQTAWKQISDLGISAKYNMEMFRDMVPTDPAGDPHAMPETVDGKAIKSAWELFGGFANTLTGLKGDFRSYYGGTTIGWTPEQIDKTMKAIEQAFGFKENAWATYSAEAVNQPLDNIAHDITVKTGRKPLMSEILGLGGDWETVQFTSKLLQNSQLMDFEQALKETAEFYKQTAIDMRMAELDGNQFSILADPTFRASNPELTSTLLSKFLESNAANMTDTPNVFQSSTTDMANGVQGVGAIQINQEFNIDLGDYEGSLSDLVRAIAQSAAIEAQQALLDIVSFRGV